MLKSKCDAAAPFFFVITCPKNHGLGLFLWKALDYLLQGSPNLQKKFIFEISKPTHDLEFFSGTLTGLTLGKRILQTSQDAIFRNESLGWNLPSKYDM